MCVLGDVCDRVLISVVVSQAESGITGIEGRCEDMNAPGKRIDWLLDAEGGW